MIKGVEIKVKLKPHLVFLIFTFVLYGNTLNHFYALDDVVVITHNKFTQQGIKGIPALMKYDTFFGYWQVVFNRQIEDKFDKSTQILEGGRYRPLSLITFALEIELFGKETIFPYSQYQYKGNAFVSHLGNVFLYLFTSCLLYLILCRLFRHSTEIGLPLFSINNNSKWYYSFPFIVTLLFLAHPIHTEVVANIKGRDEIMALLGSLGALWFSLLFFDNHKYRNLVFAGLCLFLGLLSKENVITFLVIIPVSVYYFVERNIGKILKSMIPLFVASIVFLIIRASIIGFLDRSDVTPELMNNPFMNATANETIATIFLTLLLYVKLLFFPHPLTHDYYPYHIEIVNWTYPLAIISLLFYAVIGFYAVYGLWKKRDIVSWAIWLYLVPLSIVSNLFVLIGVFMGERFIFFSSIGFAVFTGWLIYGYMPKFLKNFQTVKFLIPAVIVIILCAYTVKTISRNRAWKDNYTLFSIDVKTSTNSAKVNCLAGSLLYQKVALFDHRSLEGNDECDNAEQFLQRAIQLHPQYTRALEELGILYFTCYNDIAKSLHYFAMAIKSKMIIDDFTENSISSILSATDTLLEENHVISSPEEIILSCDELLDIHQEMGEKFGEIYYIKGVVYIKYLNNADSALVNFERALAIEYPKTAKYYEYFGATYAIAGNNSKALHFLLKAIEVGTNDHTTYLNTGTIYQRLGDNEKAEFYTQKGNEIRDGLEKNID